MQSQQFLTNFQKVGEFHTVFGHPKPSTLQYGVFDENPKLLQLRLALIEEEINEFTQAYQQHDTKEMIDAMADILYVAYGMGQALGINLDECFENSYGGIEAEGMMTNFQKVCYTMNFIESSFGSQDTQLNLCHQGFVAAFEKLKKAANDKNMDKLILNLTSILHMVYKTGHCMKVDLDKAFEIVHKSNMSKLCSTMQEVTDSIEHYKTLPDFKDVKVGYRLSADGKYYVLFNEDTGKILKNKYYTEADFSSMI